jgi:hypothetical protein
MGVWLERSVNASSGATSGVTVLPRREVQIDTFVSVTALSGGG